MGISISCAFAKHHRTVLCLCYTSHYYTLPLHHFTTRYDTLPLRNFTLRRLCVAKLYPAIALRHETRQYRLLKRYLTVPLPHLATLYCAFAVLDLTMPLPYRAIHRLCGAAPHSAFAAHHHARQCLCLTQLDLAFATQPLPRQIFPYPSSATAQAPSAVRSQARASQRT